MIADNTDTITETITVDTITFIVAGTNTSTVKLRVPCGVWGIVSRFPKSTETFVHVIDVTRRDQIILCDIIRDLRKMENDK